MLLTLAAALAAICWVVLLLLPWRPYSTRERLRSAEVAAGALRSRADASFAADLSQVTVIIPARDEEAHLKRTLRALGGQGIGLQVVVVDDQSEDGTVELARRSAVELGERCRVEVVQGRPLEPGWGGKLWALEQGLAHAQRTWVLLLDADIELDPGVIADLLAIAQSLQCTMVSVMATLRCKSRWERLLVPPFIYFFKLLYPFALVSSGHSRVAAAAGGCILVQTAALRDAGAFESLKDALIDDCTLARQVKDRGGALWLGLSHAVRSRRKYSTLGDFTQMVARTAFTQLRYSTTLLLAVTALMVLVFAVPLLVIVNDPGPGQVIIGMVGLLAMFWSFLPIVRWYGLSPAWVVTLPLAAVFYAAMTWRSAIDYWRGTRARWKGRDYATP